MNAFTNLQHRELRLRKAREEIRAVYRAGGMSDRELFDMVNFLIGQCAPEQQESKNGLLTVACDLDLELPDADAFHGLGEASLDPSDRSPFAAFHPWPGLWRES